ncbi:DUF2599 domain-containing protein [Isoptericola sp. NPDC060257]|uniref:DUF2599 domain-containing protein n=1 Tax=Isoptericola sp. NPDC060257 TaxID=3347087 RepID=UPI003660E75F
MQPHPRSRALPALALLLALGACTQSAPAPTATPSATPSAMTSATPSAAPTATPQEPVRVEVTAGDVTLEVSVPGATPDHPGAHVTPDEQAGTATVTLERSAVGDADPPTITLVSGGTFETRVDGSVTVRSDGTAVGGLSAPRGARLTAVDGSRLEVRTTGGTDHEGREDDEDHGDLSTVLGTSSVASTDWGDREGGRSLAVVPTVWAREAGQAGTDLVWAELVAADPGVDTATMHDQLECHAFGAPDKDSWNLEPWRPDVGLVATMAARCNPTP